MSRQKREEALRKTMEYLETLHNEFVEEIEKKTEEIQIHKALKFLIHPPASDGADARKTLQAWRKKSYALHRRRTRLKSMKECLARQIHDLQTALDRLKAVAEHTDPIPLNPVKGHLISLRPQRGFPWGLSYDAR